MLVNDASKTLQLHMPCMLDQFAPQTGLNIVKVLRHIGYQIDYPESQTCCGLPALHYGYGEDAKSAGEKLLGEFQGTHNALSGSQACTKMVKENYSDLFNNSLLHNNCKRTQKNFFDFTQFLMNDPLFDKAHFKSHSNAVYVSFCGSDFSFSALREGIFDKIEGLRVFNLDSSESFCCGFGGWFQSYHPDISLKMVESLSQKLSQIPSVDTIVCSEPGCMVHLNNYAKKQKLNFRIIHIADLLAESI